MPHDHHHPSDCSGHNTHAHSAHVHVHAPKDFGRAFLIGIFLNGGFVVAEVFYGVLGNSLALLADAGHNLSDVLGLVLAWVASVLVRRSPSKRFTYGLRSTSILAALINAMLLLVVTGGIGWEAILRFRDPDTVDSVTVIIVAACGIAINLGTALMFMSGRKKDLNVRAAFTHMAGDAAISLGVVLAGFAIMFTSWQWLDPAISLGIAVLVVIGTWSVLRDSIILMLHAVPPGIDADKVRQYLRSIDGVSEVHDLHIWAMSTTETALTAHLLFPNGYPGDIALNQISTRLQQQFEISHCTIQVETDENVECALASESVV